MTPVISVVVCTYNRAEWLKVALQSLCEQTLDANLFEIIVVDNASTDHTAQVVKTFPQVHYLYESRSGVSYARNTGWQTSSGDYVAYMDDDCKVPENWLATAYDIIIRLTPDIFGGAYHAFYASTRPHWFKDHYSTRQEIDQARCLQPGEHYISSGNMFVRKTIHHQYGGFQTDLGPIESQKKYGEDVEFVIRLWEKAAHPVVYYDPALTVFHLVKPEYMALQKLFYLYFIKGRDSYKIKAVSSFSRHSRLHILLHAVRIIIITLQRFIVHGLFFRDRNTYPYWQNYVYEQTLERIFWLGSLYEEFKQRE